MLAIHHRLLDRMKNVKAITAGAIAFGIGLTAAAAYVGATMVYDNFSYDFANNKVTSKVAGASTEAEVKAEKDKENYSAKAASGTTAGATTPISGQSGTTGSVEGSTALVSGVAGTAPVVGGRGAGTITPTVTAPSAPAPTVNIVPTPTPSPEPIPIVPPTDCLCEVLTPVTNQVDATVDGLGL